MNEWVGFVQSLARWLDESRPTPLTTDSSVPETLLASLLQRLPGFESAPPKLSTGFLVWLAGSRHGVRERVLGGSILHLFRPDVDWQAVARKRQLPFASNAKPPSPFAAFAQLDDYDLVVVRKWLANLLKTARKIDETELGGPVSRAIPDTERRAIRRFLAEDAAQKEKLLSPAEETPREREDSRRTPLHRRFRRR